MRTVDLSDQTRLAHGEVKSWRCAASPTGKELLPSTKHLNIKIDSGAGKINREAQKEKLRKKTTSLINL